MRRAFGFTFLLFASLLTAQVPVSLHDGQQIVLHGILTLEPAGRLQFVTVKTSAAYVPVFKFDNGKEAPGETLHEISLAGFADYALLYAHRGQHVTVTGKMATDDATPYFWHGTRLQASSIVTASGVDLRGKGRGTWVAADVGLYHARVTLPADLAAPWRYSMEGTTTEENSLSCYSNGGGDVVNCYCAHGFRPTEATATLKDKTWHGQIMDNSGSAQFAVGDDARAAELSITCSR